MITDWKQLAEARGLQLSADDLARVVPAMEALEAALRPLCAKLPHAIEPAVILSEQAVVGE